MNNNKSNKVIALSQSSKANIKLSDLSKEIGDNFLSVETRKKRIRKIINDNNISYVDDSVGWLLTKAEAQRVKELYNKKWSDISKISNKDSKEVMQLKYTIEQKEKSITNLQQQAKEYAKRIAELNKANNDLHIELKGDKEELQKSNNKLTEITQKLNESVQQANQLTINQQKLTLVNSQINEQLGQLQSDYTKLIHKYSNAQEQISSQESNMNDKDKEIKRLKEQHDKLMHRGFFARLLNKDVD